jgi:hypothetical protein
MVVNILDKNVLIDEDDYCKINDIKWSIVAEKYFCHCLPLTMDKRRPHVLMHRLIMGCVPFDGKIIDHINGDPLDNRKQNLRFCTHSENMHNQKKPKHNKSGFKGVFWDNQKNKWHSVIKINSKIKHLGYFTCIKRAYKVYCEASRLYHGVFGRII